MKIAVIGAKGMIGINLLRIMEEFLFGVEGHELAKDKSDKEQNNWEITCFGKVEGSEIFFGDRKLFTKELKDFNPDDYDLIFSAIEAELINPFKQRIKESKAIWIDKSSATRMDEDVPLVIPEVNKEILSGMNKTVVKTVASPNCVVIPVAIFLHAIGVKDITFVNITTYQSVSGAGKKAMSAFFREIKSSHLQNVQKGMFYDHPMAFNVIPAIGNIDENGYCDEEIKIIQELGKIFNDTQMEIMATTMRVPVTIGHLISLNFKMQKKLTYNAILKKLEKVGIEYSQQICTPLMAAKEDVVFACRLRSLLSNASDDNLEASDTWSIILVCDNLRKGGALNAWQIAQEMLLK